MMTIPLDNIKTRLQTQTFFTDSRKEQERIKKSPVKNLSTIASSMVPQKSYYTTAKEAAAPTSDIEIKYRDIMSTARTILREEGFRGFVKGVVPRIIAQAPASAISWTTYEMMKKFLKSQKFY